MPRSSAVFGEPAEGRSAWQVNGDRQSSDREARAERYFEQDLKGQREWYGKRASAYKNYSQILGLVVIAAGAATSFLQVFTPRVWVPAITAGLGALVALAEGWQRIARYGETWIAYRTASERMKRERRLYLNGAGAYRGLDDDTAYLQLVESVEAILAEEQQVYWRNRGGQMVLRARPIRRFLGNSLSMRNGTPSGPLLFLSHAGADTGAARALKQRIEGAPGARKRGLKVWFDKDNLRPGESWQKQHSRAKLSTSIRRSSSDLRPTPA